MARHHYHQPRAIGSLLREPHQAFARAIVRGLQVCYPDLRLTHMGIMQHLDHPPAGTGLTELAERMQISKQALVELVDYLERGGYLERMPDPNDRRAKIIRFTELGWRVHEDATGIGLGIQSAWINCLGDQKWSTLMVLLAELGACVEQLGTGSS